MIGEKKGSGLFSAKGPRPTYGRCPASQKRVLTPFFALLVLAGCGGHESTVSGTVTLDGKPLGRGTVTFHPQANGTPGYGAIGPEGQYTVQTNNREGLTPGNYAITVVALEPSTAPSSPMGMPSPGKPLAPRRYATVDSSDLRHAVEPGPNRIDLQLTSD